MAEDQIIGFRRDRIGARLICLLNVMRLARATGVRGRYLWLSDPASDHTELNDPHDFLAPDFVAAHIEVVPAVPDLSRLPNVGTAAPGMSLGGFRERLAAGERYECDTMAETVRFMDESLESADAEIHEIARSIRLAAPLARELEKARALVARAGGGAPVAIHVRRGDILDGDPWSYSSWATKYVPDEFYRAFISMSEGPVLSFSDTPAAVAHLGQGDPRILPVTRILDAGKLPQAARDLLELLLMADCERVGAPSHSAFSRAAAVAGQCRIVSLPDALPEDLRNAAYDALLERVISRQDSFFAPGDLAQTAGFAARHAVVTGRGPELIGALAGNGDFLERFPFLYKDLAVTAWASGRMQKARKLAQLGLNAPLIRHRDKPQCRQVLLVAPAGNQPEQNRLVDAQFLTLLFSGRAAEGPIIPVLARRLVRQKSESVQALLFPPRLLQAYLRPTPEGGDGAKALPLWTLRLDWAEFVRGKALLRELREWPRLWEKMKPVASGLSELEDRLAGGDRPGASDAEAMRFGFCAAILRLNGRLKRSFALLNWLEEIRPGQVLTHKRLADTCFAAGQAHGGWKWLDSAMALAPENPMLRLSGAIRAAQQGDGTRARRHLAEAEALRPDLDLTAVVRRGFIRQLP
ncbi:tetratricopeptide repeat protein [Paracoccus halophilus]|nr:hypothetical protein [Paracoccus halophilus]